MKQTALRNTLCHPISSFSHIPFFHLSLAYFSVEHWRPGSTSIAPSSILPYMIRKKNIKKKIKDWLLKKRILDFCIILILIICFILFPYLYHMEMLVGTIIPLCNMYCIKYKCKSINPPGDQTLEHVLSHFGTCIISFLHILILF